jgi:hypothetical protein
MLSWPYGIVVLEWPAEGAESPRRASIWPSAPNPAQPLPAQPGRPLAGYGRTSSIRAFTCPNLCTRGSSLFEIVQAASIIDNCAKVRSRRTINLVLFTNRPRCCARGYPNEKLVLKCDREFKKVQRCKNSTPLAASLVASYRVGKSLRCQREERYTTRGTLMPDRAIPWAKKTRPGR